MRLREFEREDFVLGAHSSSTGVDASSGSRCWIAIMSCQPRSFSRIGMVRGQVSTTWSESGSSNTW